MSKLYCFFIFKLVKGSSSTLCCILSLVFIVGKSSAAEIDVLECGVDPDVDVRVGEIPHETYPWLGVLYYEYDEGVGELRSVTTVALIQEEFLIAAAADIGPMPKDDFRKKSRVILGHDWEQPGRKIRNYVIHPEYAKTYNTIALIQLVEPVRETWIKTLCPPPERLISPDLYVVKFKEDYERLQKEVIPVGHIPGEMCKEFYVRTNLDMPKMRPPQAACVATLEEQGVCVWDAGSALVTRDVWGRWQLLGVGTRGPGCGAPSRYLDMMSYMPWVKSSLDQFRRLTISKIDSQRFVLRSSNSAYQRFGACDEEEKINLIFRESIVLRTDNNQYQFLTYNMTIVQTVEYTCLTLELVNASAASEMRVKHVCPRNDHAPCYRFQGSTFDISVFLIFSDKCTFEMYAWGHTKKMTLIDYDAWRLEEGTFYKDFSVDAEEYKGPFLLTEFGFEPINEQMWSPQYDVWTTTPYSNVSTTTTTEAELQEIAPDKVKAPPMYYEYVPTTTEWNMGKAPEMLSTSEDYGGTTTNTPSTRESKKKFRRKTTTTLPPEVTTIAGGFLFPRWG